jgi:DNA-binding NarL/FixJ family response regulator
MNRPNTVRILLVDDHEMVRRGLRALIETQPGWEVCGEAADGRTAVTLAGTLAPHVVVMDLSMPQLNGFEAARRILEKARAVRILILSMHESEQLVREVLSAGVRGYVLKSDAGRDLIAAVEALLRGETFFTSKLAARLYSEGFHPVSRRTPARLPGPLTRREREILQLLAEGKTNRDVGRELKISVKTAETHRARIMRKLEVDSVADLVRYAIRNGFIAL